MKVSNWDNGLTAEQQAEMDAKWEELLAQVKKIDPKLYKKIQDESLEYFLTDDEPVVVTENNQYQLNL
jgi:redox-regulated HSP33 family molecular chaperone